MTTLELSELTEGARRYERYYEGLRRSDFAFSLRIAAECEGDPWRIAMAKKENQINEGSAREIINSEDTTSEVRSEAWLEAQRCRYQENELELYLALLWAKPLGLIPTGAHRRVVKQVLGIDYYQQGLSHDLFDHPYFWRSGRGLPMRNAETFVITSHPYNVNERFRENAASFAERTGAEVEYPDFPSWWNQSERGSPVGTRLVVWKASPNAEAIRKQRQDQELHELFTTARVGGAA